MFKFLKASLAAVAGVLLTAGAVQAQTHVQGAGATFPLPLYQKWVQAYNASHSGVQVDYQGIGSGGGIKGITDKTLDFAGSDAPMTDSQEQKAGGQVYHIPTVAGPVVITYNLQLSKPLVLDGPTIGKIFMGQIHTWDDAAIKALNPGLDLPSKPIVVAHRSDGSGTTYIFTNYLCKVSGEWKNEIGNSTSVQWPVGLGGKGNPGVTAIVKNTDGGLGYVEYAYAKSNNLPVATLRNKAGKLVTPSIAGVNAAAANALKELPDDFKVSITDAGGDESWPIAGFTYILLRPDMSYTGNREVAADTLKFVQWGLTDGQKMAGELDYAHLPDYVQKAAVERLKKVKYNGEPLLK